MVKGGEEMRVGRDVSGGSGGEHRLPVQQPPVRNAPHSPSEGKLSCTARLINVGFTRHKNHNIFPFFFHQKVLK